MFLHPEGLGMTQENRLCLLKVFTSSCELKSKSLAVLISKIGLSRLVIEIEQEMRQNASNCNSFSRICVDISKIPFVREVSPTTSTREVSQRTEKAKNDNSGFKSFGLGTFVSSSKIGAFNPTNSFDAEVRRIFCRGKVKENRLNQASPR